MVKVNWQVAAAGYYHVVVRMVIFSNFSNNFIIFSSLTKSSDMLNKNTLGVKKVRGQSEATMVI